MRTQISDLYAVRIQPAITPAIQGTSQLVSAQNPDGGWGYAGRHSWIEPTALALLSLSDSLGSGTPSVRKALDWLVAQRRSDGGWSPHPSVRESTSVSALAALALHRYGRLDAGDPVLPWLLRNEGAESGWLNRFRRLLLGGDTEEIRYNGWPWFPGAAAWVVPTALTIVAMREIMPIAPHLGFAGRIEAGCRFLMSRRCTDHGWNHGSSRALGYHGESYPETTGVALLALRGFPAKDMRDSHQRALTQLTNCRSIEGWSWLQMGLRAHGVTASQPPPAASRRLDPRELAIYHMGLAAARGADPWTRPR